MMKSLYLKNIAIKITASILLLLCINTFGLVSQVEAQTITGKVVAIKDGDSIIVLQDHTQYEIRLYGIDTPEFRQAFGNRATKFTSDLVFG
jgi:endonuclease YncB( thermonuclease family)